jgi:hypothetical protein
VVGCLRKSAGRAGDVERRRDLGYADDERNLGVHGCGEGYWIARANGIGAGVDCGDHRACDADHYINEPGCGEEWNLLQYDPEREWRNTGLYMVGEWKLACRIDDDCRGCDLRNADGSRNDDLHRYGFRQRFTSADSLRAGVAHGKCAAGDAEDYVDEPGCGADGKRIQHDPECEWRNTGLYVVGEWKLACGIDDVGLGCNLRNPDDHRNGELYRDGV